MEVVAIVNETGATAVIEVDEEGTVLHLKENICTDLCLGFAPSALALRLPDTAMDLQDHVQLCNIELSNGDYVEVYRQHIDVSSVFEGPMLGHSGAVTGLAVSHCGSHLFSSGRDRVLRKWHTQGRHVSVIAEAEKPLMGVTLSHDGTLAFTGCEDGSLIGYGTTDSCKTVVMHQRPWARGVLLDRQGMAYIISTAANVSIKDVATGETRNILEGHTDGVTGIVLSHCGSFVYTCSRDKTVRQWSTTTYKCLKTMHGHDDWVSSICLSTCGEFIFTGSWDTSVRMWSDATGQSVLTMRGHRDWVTGVASHPKWPVVYSCSRDNTIREWNIQTGLCHRSLTGHTMGVTSIIISPKTNQLFSCGEDKTIHAWNMSGTGDRNTVCPHASPLSDPAGRSPAKLTRKEKRLQLRQLQGSKEAEGCTPQCTVC